jgi:RNA polymerase sigma-70 factor (ECF subfamily)
MSSSFARDLVDLIPRMRRFALSLSGRVDDADDLVQAACERALKAQDQYEAGTRLDAWMFRIIRNLWIDQIRKRKTEGVREDVDDMPHLGGDDGRDITTTRRTVRDVEAALDRLPREQREVVRLVCIEDVSYRDAAGRLDVPIGTVMSRLSRARLALARDLGLSAGDRILPDRGAGP